MTPGHRQEVRTVHRGAWLDYRVAEYRDVDGKLRRWEFVDRKGEQPAAEMVTRCRPSGDLLLVRQYRPALDADTIEFPAGLIDPGETPGETALRELREETGYAGTVRSVSPVLCTTPGLASERVYLVVVDVDEHDPAGGAPHGEGPDRDRIEVIRMPQHEAAAQLTAMAADGVVIDSRVWAYLMNSPG